MVKISKRYRDACKMIDPEKQYSLSEAAGLLQKMPSVKFDETVELSVNLGVNPKQSSQAVRGTVNLPHGSGKKVTVAAFTESPEDALTAGAEYAGLEDLIKKVQDGWSEFDVAVATPNAMKQVRSIARILGPRGLMPNPKSGTVSEDISSAIEAVKAGRVEFKMDKTGTLAIIVGKRSFSSQALEENAQTIIDAVGGARPDNIKNQYIKNMALSASMSPGIKLSPELYRKF